MPRLLAGLLAGLLMLAIPGGLPAQEQAAARPLAIVAELDGIIHPVSAEYLTGTIDQADASNAAVVIFILRTPGGLLDSTRTIVSRMLTSRAPVVVFVSPSGARAASAGFILALASDVAVMAPGTHIGAAHPVSGGGQSLDETMSSKVASDTAAYARTLAEARGRNVMLAAEAVLQSRSFTDSEALAADPRLIDFAASDLDALLRELDGRTVTRFDGRRVTVDTSDATVRRIEMTLRQEFLSAIAHPQIAYLLMTFGILGLTVELWNPGAIAPGVIGGLCLLLAFFALQIVPMGTAGVLLILFGVGLLAAEVLVPSFGLLGIGGIVALVIGSVMATQEVPGVEVTLRTIVPAAVALAAGVLLLGRLAMKAQRQRAQTGADAMLNQTGRTRHDLKPGEPGQIDARGEIWTAVSTVPIAAGVQVRIVGLDGLTVLVEPLNESPSEGAREWKR